MKRIFDLLPLGVAVLLASGASLAQTARDGGGASPQAMQQLQQLAAERTALQAENTRMKQELEALRRERDELKDGAASGERRTRIAQAELARASATREGTAQELEQQRARTQDLVEKSREIIDTLRSVELQRAELEQQSRERGGALEVCGERNRALYQMNAELLDRIENRSVWSALSRGEPFTQITRARLENLIEDYRYKAEDQKLQPGPPQAAD